MKKSILIITQGIWTETLGAVKVHIDLKKEYEKLGYQVDKISYEDLYPNGQNPLQKIFGKFFTDKIHDILKKIADKYDFIDVNYSCILKKKETYNFNGLLLVRSHGIQPIYDLAEQNITRYSQALEKGKGKVSLKTRIGNLYRSMQKKTTHAHFLASVACADIVHCLNSEEFNYLENCAVPVTKLLLLPNGIPDLFLKKAFNLPFEEKQNNLIFIGSWTIRKGIKDMNEILDLITVNNRINKFKLMGGHTSSELVQIDFSTNNRHLLEVLPSYNPVDLIEHLKDSKVGIFPSYIEGFGLSVVEQLACGVPVVAYRVPGPKDILRELDAELLAEPGNIIDFASKVNAILNLSATDYKALSNKCRLIAEMYSLKTVAEKFVASFESNNSITSTITSTTN